MQKKEYYVEIIGKKIYLREYVKKRNKNINIK